MRTPLKAALGLFAGAALCLTPQAAALPVAGPSVGSEKSAA